MHVRRSLGRGLGPCLRKDSPRRFHLVLGPRRVGKTTAMYQVVADLIHQGVRPEHLVWLRLDHPILMRTPLGELVRAAHKGIQASAANPAYFFLDELAYAPDWDTWLKTFYDEQWPVRILGTSSATADLKTRRMESGVGRWDEHYHAPYLLSEYIALRGGELPPVSASLPEAVTQAVEGTLPQGPGNLTDALRRFLLVGGFPELLNPEPGDLQGELLRSQRVLRSDAVERAVYKDIPLAFGMSDPLKLECLLYILAGQVGGIVRPAGIQADLGISAPTLERYISFLERSYLLFLLHNYSPAEESVQRRGRKVYFTDGAVRNAALLRGITPLDNPDEMGVLIENAAATHLHAYAIQSGGRLFYWREGRHEVDFILRTGSEHLAFEVSASTRHSRKGLDALAAKHPRFRGRTWMVTPAPFRRAAAEDAPGHLPVSEFLRVVSQCAEMAMLARL
jgi:uncharacterized protein